MGKRFWFFIFIITLALSLHGQGWQKLVLPDTSKSVALFATSSSLLSFSYMQPYYYISYGIGSTWTKVSLPLPQNRYYRLEYLPIHFHRNEFMLSYWDETDNVCHYFLSVDGGKTVEALQPPFAGRTQLQGFERVGNVLFVWTTYGEYECYYSKDRGQSWEKSPKCYESDGSRFRHISFPDTLFSSVTGVVDTWTSKMITGAEPGVKIAGQWPGALYVADRYFSMGGCEGPHGDFEGCQLYDVDTAGHATRIHVEALGYDLSDPTTYKLKSVYKKEGNLVLFYNEHLYETFDYGLSWNTLPMPKLEAEETIYHIQKFEDQYLLTTYDNFGFKDMLVFNATINSLITEESAKEGMDIRYLSESGRLSIQNAPSRELDVIIYTPSGHTIHHEKINKGTQEVDLPTLPKGMFFVQISAGQSRSVKKIVVF